MSLFSELAQYFDIYYKQVRFASKSLFFLCAVVYLGYHSISGQNGYHSYRIVKKQMEERQKVLDRLKLEFDKLKTDVEFLSNSSLDLDLLEERCRIMLNYGYPSEIIIRTNSIYDNTIKNY